MHGRQGAHGAMGALVRVVFATVAVAALCWAALAHGAGAIRNVHETPQVNSVTPSSGPDAGGTTVKIKGRDFREVTAV